MGLSSHLGRPSQAPCLGGNQLCPQTATSLPLPTVPCLVSQTPVFTQHAVCVNLSVSGERVRKRLPQVAPNPLLRMAGPGLQRREPAGCRPQLPVCPQALRPVWQGAEASGRGTYTAHG